MKENPKRRPNTIMQLPIEEPVDECEQHFFLGTFFKGKRSVHLDGHGVHHLPHSPHRGLAPFLHLREHAHHSPPLSSAFHSPPHHHRCHRASRHLHPHRHPPYLPNPLRSLTPSEYDAAWPPSYYSPLNHATSTCTNTPTARPYNLQTLKTMTLLGFSPSENRNGSPVAPRACSQAGSTAILAGQAV